MFEDYFTTYDSVRPPKFYIDNSELIESNIDFNKISVAKEFKDFVRNNTEDDSVIEDFAEDNPFEIKVEEPSVRKVVDQNDTSPISQKHFEDKLDTQKDYTNTMYHYLHEALENNGVDGDTWAPILVAHTAIESGWGNDFSKRNNNFGGIKGKGSGNLRTKEWSPQRGYYVTNDSFQSYSSIADFADNYVKKLKYKFNAFNGSTNDYLKNIRQKGYFTAKLSDYQKSLNKTLRDVNKYLNTNDDLLKIDIEDLLKSEGITSINGKQIKFGNKNLRSANASYGSKNSNHKRRDPHTGNAMARDISIVGGTQQDYADFRQLLLSNPRIVQYMASKNWGIINEITPAILAKTRGTGNHFHFGPDRMAVRTWKAWLQNPNIPITQAL